jgi:polysaccharide pyruvyl transferase WcaK-like protein
MSRQFSRRSLLQTAGCAPALTASAPPAAAPSAAGGKPYSIFITFAWSFSNIGDIAITPGILRLLQKHIPNHEPIVVTNSSFEQHRQYLSPRFPKCRVFNTPFASPQPRPADFMEAFNNADMLLYNSGTVLSYGRWDRDWNRTMRFALPLIMAREAGKPYGVYCQSFDPIQPPAEILMAPLLSGARFIFARDGESLKYIKRLGVKAPIMEFGPDATFGFDQNDDAFADQFLARYRLEPRKFISVVVRTKIQGFLDDQREQLHARKMREIIAQSVESSGEPVLICPEVVHEIEPARRLLYEPLPDAVKQKVRFQTEFWSPDQARSVFARARVHVSMDMHSVIMALAAGTPVLHPRFVEAGIKAWMLRDLGVEDWLFDIDRQPASAVSSKLVEIRADYPAALARVKSARAIVERRQAETMAIVRQTLEDARRSRRS